ncbi:Palmitoyltransferase [Favolaschia claudopus]|uniref:Palmitoyltransferase n=1 Tax=Favolaschia claudopus TaxID=2862362 RepID=A0AAW0BWZ7_9AGAR
MSSTTVQRVLNGRRGTRAVEFCIQLFVLSVIAFGLYITSVEVSFLWIIVFRRQTLVGGLYLIATFVPLSAAGLNYVSLIKGRRTHNVPRYLMPDIDDLTEPYECIDSEGHLASCAKCDGVWKPPRTHHCSTCGVCRMEFDHHCPWVGNCVTRNRMRNFLALLVLVPVAYSVSMVQLYHPLVRHISLALDASHQDPWTNQMWWDWYGSWIFFGGPFGRWIFGTALGFRILKTRRRTDLPLLEQPNLRLFSICSIGLLFSLFALILAIWTLRDLLRGLTTLDAMQQKGSNHVSRFVCIPKNASCELHDDGAQDNLDNGNDLHSRYSKVGAVLPAERPYDLGFWANLWDVFGRTPRHPANEAKYRWPKLNPILVRRIHKPGSSESESIAN